MPSLPLPGTQSYPDMSKYHFPKKAPHTLDRGILIHYDRPMKTAEVEINKQMTLKLNDREHKAFKLQCVREGRDMSVVIRELMREYVASKKGKR